MFDIIVIGGTTYDIFFQSKNFSIENNKLLFDWGEKFVVDKMDRGPGGGGANAAVGFSRLGLKTALWSQVGNEALGNEIVKALEDEKVSPTFLQKSDFTSTSCIFLSQTGERSIVMYRGENDLLDLTNLNKNQINLFWQTKWIYLADLTGENKDFNQQLLSEAKDHKVKTAFLPGRDEIEAGIQSLENCLQSVDVLILNLFEASKLFQNISRHDTAQYHGEAGDEKINELLQHLKNYGPAIVVITHDKTGCHAIDDQQIHFIEAPNVPDDKIIDTTGAGDAFSAGFIGGLVYGKNVQECLQWGQKNAGAVIVKMGAQTGLLRKKEMKN